MTKATETVEKKTRKPGYLSCDECTNTYPFQGPGEPHEWPLHRCREGRIRPMHAWHVEDPARPPLPKAF